MIQTERGEYSTGIRIGPEKSVNRRNADVTNYYNQVFDKPEEWVAHFKYQQSSDPSMPLRDFWKIYMEDMGKRLKETTIENKEHIWRCKIEPYFGDLPINEITPSRIRRWQSEMIEKGFKPTYLKSINSQQR